MSQLEDLRISWNTMTGPFPCKSAGGLQKLNFIDLSNNLIKSLIPSWLCSLPSLEYLYLSSNRLTGKVGNFQSKRLLELDLSNNRLNIDLGCFSDLSAIQSIRISSNRVTNGATANESANVTLPHLSELYMSSCEIEEFPNLLRNLPFLRQLDLSNNKIHGPIPRWFESLPLQSLIVSRNHLTHARYLPFYNLMELDLHSNSLQGTFSSSICNMSSLKILNLSNNKLSGKIPECIGNLAYLFFVDLRRNEFRGTIPTFGMANQVDGVLLLRFLGLNQNHLEGILPQSLINCTSLEVLDVGNNMINDTFPLWLQTLPQLQIVILKSNRFYGSIVPPSVSNNSFKKLRILDLSYNNFTGLLPDKLFGNLHAMENQDESISADNIYMTPGDTYQYSVTLSVKGESVELNRVLRTFTSIDLSSNNFQGSIPESLAYLHSLQLLNLSHNKIDGNIPPPLGRMTSLEQLDLSSNQLTGNIPSTLTDLTFLAVLNLSDNHLVGRIPEGKQFSTFANDSYVGNSELCGVPLTRACGNNGTPPSAVATVQEDDESSFMMGFTWQAVVMGYGAGTVFGFIIGSIMICRGKPKWFVRVPFVEAAICMTRFKKRDRVVRARR